MIPIPPFSSCEDKGYDFSIGRFNRFIFVGRPGIVFVNGGVPPYNWTITGEAFDLSYAQTNDQFNMVLTNANTVIRESVEEVTVTDSCGREGTFIVNCCGRYLCCEQQTIPFRVDQIDYLPHTDYVILNLAGGCPPFNWKVQDRKNRAIFLSTWTITRQNVLLFKDKDDVIGIEYTVTDACGTIVHGFVYDQLQEYDLHYFGTNWAAKSMIPGWSTQHTFYDPEPIPSINGSKVILFSTGSQHSLAVTENNRFYGVGNNGRGELGLGHKGPVYEITELINPEPGVPIRQVCAKPLYMSLLLLANGNLYTAGRNNRGNLGIGSNYSDHSEWQFCANNILWVDGQHMFHSGDMMCCAIDTDYRGLFWGYNYYGQMPVSKQNAVNRPAIGTMVLGLNAKVAQISMPGKSSLVLLQSGQLYGCGATWSSGTDGYHPAELKGTVFKSDDNTPVSPPAIRSISSGYEHTVAVDSGGLLWVCGYDSNSNCILGRAGTHTDKVFKPIGHDEFHNCMKVICMRHTTFVWQADGTVLRWGSGLGGTLGEHISYRCVPTPWAYTHFHPDNIISSMRGMAVRTEVE